jgi:hypothetical protein
MGFLSKVGDFLTGGVGSLIGDVVGGYLGYKGQKQANQMNYQIAQQQMAHQKESQAAQFGFEDQQAARAMDFSNKQATRQMRFQERMSNSAYQRAMQDMKKSGLNPLLAYTQGGASSPGGAAGSPSKGSGSTTPGASAVMKNQMEMMAHSVMNMGQKLADIKKTEAEADFTRNKEHISGSAARVGEMVEGAVTGAMDYLGGVGSSNATAKTVMRELDEARKWIQNEIPKLGQSTRKGFNSWYVKRAIKGEKVPDRIMKDVDKNADTQSIRDLKSGKIYFFRKGKPAEWAWYDEYKRQVLDR